MVIFRPLATIIRVPVADGFAQALQPCPRPRKLDAEERETNRYQDERRSGCHDHYHANNQHSYAYDRNDDSSRHLVGHVECSLDHQRCPSFLRRLAVALGP